MDDGDPQVIRRDAEGALAMLGQELDRGFAVLIGMHGRPEDMGEVTPLDDRRGNRRGDPEQFLLRLEALGERHGMGRAEDAHHHIHTLLADQALRLVDGDLGAALAVRRDGLHGTSAGAAALVEQFEGDLGAGGASLRSSGREGARQIEHDADPDGRTTRGLGHGGEGKRSEGQRSAAHDEAATRNGHSKLPA